MSDSIQKKDNSALTPTQAGATTVEIPGDNNSFYFNNGQMQVSPTFIMSDPRKPKPETVGTAGFSLNRDIYHLFVINGEDFQSDSFIVPKDRALTESINDDLKAKYATLNSVIIPELLTFPALFLSENSFCGRASDDQIAYTGVVRGIKIRDNGIQIYFQPICRLRQQLLNDHDFELGVQCAYFRNELAHTHWTLKQIDLIDVLQKAGASFFPLVNYIGGF